jgi:carboxymethylenebutenolidase
MATMAAEPFVNHVPTMMGGVGAGGVADFYDKYFIGHWPVDTTIIRSVAPSVPIVSSTR